MNKCHICRNYLDPYYLARDGFKFCSKTCFNTYVKPPEDIKPVKHEYLFTWAYDSQEAQGEMYYYLEHGWHLFIMFYEPTEKRYILGFCRD